MKLRNKELEEEAEGLKSNDEEDAPVDAFHRMKKVNTLSTPTYVKLVNSTQLLRRFNDLMLETTLQDDGEECSICFDKMALRKCSRSDLTCYLELQIS